MKSLKKITLLILVLSIFSLKPLLFSADNSKKLTIFYAANLITSMNELMEEFKKTHPDTEIIAEPSGSVLAVKKITELNRNADLIFVADYKLIDEMLAPKYADWGIMLYRDPIVIAFTERSRYTNEINSGNWYKILARPDVKYGYANPNLAPIGYRALMVWQLADLYYNEKIGNKSVYDTLKEKCPEDYIRPDVSELIPTLESMALDYLFVYQSTAEQHNLKFIRLPEEINLSSEDCEYLYKKVSVTITNKKGATETIYGKPVIFAFTILKDAANRKAAIDFVRLLLSEKGRSIMKQNFQPQIVPAPVIHKDKIPEELKEITVLKTRS
ncbi:MAG: tungstate ABC transporter substrate-binding protein WtpA [Candidatus Omnitrophota bacterium]